MKRILLYVAIVLALASCKSGEIEFPSYTYQTVYFPVQYPQRTLVLGESRSDNTIDLEHAFSIGASVGGMYENDKDRSVKIAYVPELADSLVAETGDTIAVLPETYYSASSLTEIFIPAGSFNGKIRIDLNDSFFEDPLTTKLKYVIPLVILPATEDSVLSGSPATGIDEPNRHVASDWVAGFTPKDYTLFAIKYINRYHGTYLHRGVDKVLDESGAVIESETSTYQERYIEEDLLTTTTTASLSECIIDRLGGDNTGGIYQMKLTFNDGTKTINISSVEGGTEVSGSGTFKEAEEGEVWGGRGHMTLYLDYTYVDAEGATHEASDVLVYRDNAVIYEEFKVNKMSPSE